MVLTGGVGYTTCSGGGSATAPGTGSSSGAEPDDHGLGRSRGGFTTKLHLAVEQGQKPMSIVVTAGQPGNYPQFEAVLERVRVPRIGPGQPPLGAR